MLLAVRLTVREVSFEALSGWSFLEEPLRRLRIRIDIFFEENMFRSEG